MSSRRRLLACCLAVAVPGLAGRLAAEDPRGVRADLQSLEIVLGRAVDQVSRPYPGLLPGVGTARGYHLRGVGAVFVLAPRALPREGEVFALGGRSPHLRLHRQAERLARDAERLRERERERREAARERQLELLAAQVEALQREAEAAQAEAEKAFEQVARELQARLAPALEAPPAPEPAPTPVAAPEAPPAPMPVPAPEAPPPPPWRFWFETREAGEERSAERIVEDVRIAVTRALESQGAGLRSVGPDELVAVAVDFVSGSVFAPGSQRERTLVVRVRKKELDQRRAGTLAPEELRRRIEYVEY